MSDEYPVHGVTSRPADVGELVRRLIRNGGPSGLTGILHRGSLTTLIVAREDPANRPGRWVHNAHRAAASNLCALELQHFQAAGTEPYFADARSV